MAEFREVRRSALLPDQIAADIMAKITDGDLVPGDTLPTEHSLAGTFGVSRNVVREAIARLRSDGVVESRQGRGAVVNPLSARQTFRVDIRALGKSDNLADLFELRGLLAIEAAGLAAERRGGADLEEMRTAISVMESGKSVDDNRLEADTAFHRALGRASGNSYLSTFIDYISARLEETAREASVGSAWDDLLPAIVSEHRSILHAVEAADKAAARSAMAAHIQGIARRLNVPVKPCMSR